MPAKNSGGVLYLDKLTHNAVKALDPTKTAVLATLSPIEVHGPHLPLGQDYFEAWELAKAASGRLAEEREDWTFLLLPPIPVATDCVPQLGSVNFPVDLVRRVAFHALQPFAQAGFARLLYSSFHGGPRHNCALEAAGVELTEKYGVPTASLFSMVLSKVLEGDVFFEGIKDADDRTIELDQLKEDRHAGFVETSLGLHLWPDLVEEGWADLPGLSSDPDAGEKDTNDSYLFGYADKPSLATKVKRDAATAQAIYRAIKHFSEHTYLGHPQHSSARQGKMLFEHLTGIATETASEFLDKGTAMNVHSPLWKLQRVLLNPVANKIANDWLKLYA